MTEKDKAAIVDIFRAAIRIQRFISGMTEQDFLSDEKTHAAVQLYLITMGEAVKRLSSSVFVDAQDIPWQKIARMRDLLVHHYDRVNFATVWNVANDSIPELVERLLSNFPHLR